MQSETVENQSNDGLSENSREPKVITSKSDAELKEIARDIHSGQIFCHWHLPEHDYAVLKTIFMPLGLGALSDWTREEFGQIGLFYEHISKAGPISVNCYPCFFSMKLLNLEDTEKVIGYFEKIQAAMESI